MSTNLWPEFHAVQSPSSPKKIIEERGAGLKERTKGVVQFYRSRTTVAGDEITLNFTLYSPHLSYHFPFLQARFSIENNYPVTLIADKMAEIKANSDEELIGGLSKIFNAPTTVETIQKLMSLADAPTV